MSVKGFYRNPFKSVTITNERLLKFGQDHLQRLNANNVNDDLTETINSVTPLVNGLAAAINSEDSYQIQQRSLTLQMRETLNGFKKDVSRFEGAIRAKWDAGSPQYQQFFPHGVTEYRKANLTNAERLINRFTNTATQYIGDLGQEFVDKFTAHHSAFVAARQAQLQQFGEVDEAKAASRDTRQALESQLLQNIHTLGLKYSANPERSMDFFDMSSLRPPKRSKSVTPPIE